MTTVFNPFKVQEAPQVATASAATDIEQELATASALTIQRSDICPKCGNKMATAYLFDNRPINYCFSDRVSLPRE